MINKDDLWRDSLTILSGRVQAISFEVWIAKLKPVCFLKNKLVLLTNSPSSKNTIMKNYLPQITAAVKEVNPAIEDVEIILEGQKEEYLKKQEFIVNEEWVVEDSKPVIKDNGFSFNKNTPSTASWWAIPISLHLPRRKRLRTIREVNLIRCFCTAA